MYNPNTQFAFTSRDVIFSKDSLLLDGDSSSLGQLNSPSADLGEFYSILDSTIWPQLENNHDPLPSLPRL